MNEYALLKVIHLGSLVFWLGPALGAWLVLKVVEDGSYLANSTAQKVSRMFFYTVILEHIAFISLIVTGSMLASKYHFTGSVWLTQKLYVIGLIIIPLEVVDVILGNWLAASASRKLYAGSVVKPWERRALDLYHGWFTKLALLLIPLSVLMVMYLAVSKTGV